MICRLIWAPFGCQVMEKGFWGQLKKPIMGLAPMANVTDAAFRRMFAECGKPDVFWTEFVSVEGLLSRGKGKLLTDFWYSKGEHPIVAQIFGSKPEQFEKVAVLIRELGFDGIDINMGCPDKDVEKQGGGAALMKTPELAREIIRAAKRGAGDLPVSIKTRIGYNTNELDTWIPALLEEGLAELTVHLRTRKEMSDVPAHWELARDVVALRDRYSPETLLMGNGDVSSLEQAHARVKDSGMDGVMVGRGAFGNPWFFSGHVPDLRERLLRMVMHTELYEVLYHSDAKIGRLKSFDVMKKHFKAYIAGFDHAKELRLRLMEATNAGDVRKVTEEFLETL